MTKDQRAEAIRLSGTLRYVARYQPIIIDARALMDAVWDAERAGFIVRDKRGACSLTDLGTAAVALKEDTSP